MTLIERLSKATGPDRVLDLAISAAIDFRGVFGGHEWKWSPMADELISKTGGVLDPVQFVPLWTRSIDCALVLVPEGWTRAVDATAPECGIDVDLFAKGEERVKACHDNEAIATCIAALKAVELTRGEQDRGVNG
jgi:hypothetical protein